MSSLPNALTVGRILLVPLFVAAFFWPGETGRWTAFFLFVLAGITDLIDGIVARKLNAVSSFGRMLDPIADKLIVGAALLMLTADGTLAGWALIPALIILSREILVSGLREFLAETDVSLPVTRVAKWKTSVQVIALAALIAAPMIETVYPGVIDLAVFALWCASALTLYTGFVYWQAGIRYMRGPET